MTVGIIGSGPAAQAVTAAIEDVDTDVRSIGIDTVETVQLPVVIDVAGSDVFDRVNDRDTGVWMGIELGGIGGHAQEAVDAAVAVFGPEAGCYDCLRTRVTAATDEDPDESPSTTTSDARLAGAVGGRHAVAILSGAMSPGAVIELPYQRRQLLPLPGCGCDPGRDRTLTRETETRGLEAAVDAVEPAIDDRLGLLTQIGEAHSFPAPYYLATLCATDEFSDVAVGRQAAGVAVDWNAALMKAAGEALERYSAGVYRTRSFRTAAADELDRTVPVSAFVLPDEGFETPDPEAWIDWVEGEDLTTGEDVWLPAEFVHFPPPEQRHKPSITTGLGLGNGTVEALLAGTYEVIERDATMLAWYSTFEPLGLDVVDDEIATLRKRARAEDLETTLLLTTQDIDVPVVTAAVHREDEWPQFAVGSDAHLDPVQAAQAALAEALQNWMELRGMGRQGAESEASAIGRYADFPRAAREYIDHDQRIDARAIGPDPVPTGQAALTMLTERLANNDLSVYGARLTPRDVDALGFEAVRVLVPTAQPLFTGDRYFGTRAREVPKSLGFQPRLDREPHPYP